MDNNVTKHQPVWPNQDDLFEVVNKLKKLPSLVYSEETRLLKNLLSKIKLGKSFILQAGNCAESFNDCNGTKIHDYLRVIFLMSSILQQLTSKNIIKIGRIAGQYSKPRSNYFEEIAGITLPSYMGDNINCVDFNENSRTPNPEKLLEGYFRSAATLNLIRAFINGGYYKINFFNDWEKNILESKYVNEEDYKKFKEEINESVDFNNLTINTKFENSFFISHEALILDYEESFSRIDTIQGGRYNTSAHSVWLGDRTRFLNSAHVEYLSTILNPIGIKLGPNYNLNDTIDIIKKLNPNNEEGKIMIISRMGQNKINLLKDFIDEIILKKLNIILLCDPMHGNTVSYNGIKTRIFDHILNETIQFIDMCYKNNVIPGGIHLELTSEMVTECIGSLSNINYENLSENYLSNVDPRLNSIQAIDFCLKISKKIKNEKII